MLKLKLLERVWGAFNYDAELEEAGLGDPMSEFSIQEVIIKFNMTGARISYDVSKKSKKEIIALINEARQG